jgi:hypothetical protein
MGVLGNGERQATTAEAQPADDLNLFVLLQILILTHHTDVGNTGSHTLGYVIITEEQYLKREIARLYQECPLYTAHFDVGLTKKTDGIFIQSTL